MNFGKSPVTTILVQASDVVAWHPVFSAGYVTHSSWLSFIIPVKVILSFVTLVLI